MQAVRKEPRQEIFNVIPKRTMKGYTKGIPVKIYIDEMKYDLRVMVYKLLDFDTEAGYRVYESRTAILEDFDFPAE